MKTCYNCGSQMPDDALVCTNCGSPLSGSTIPGQNYQQQYTSPGNGSDINTKAVIALIFGIGGLLLTLAAPILPGVSSVVGIVLCTVGIIFGVKARNETGVCHYRCGHRGNCDLYRMCLYMRGVCRCRCERLGLFRLF